MSLATPSHFMAHLAAKQKSVLLVVKDGVLIVSSASKTPKKLFDIKLEQIVSLQQGTVGFEEGGSTVPRDIPSSRCFSIKSPDFNLFLSADTDEEAAAWFDGLKQATENEELSENAFSNEKPTRRVSKNSRGVASMMNGGVTFNAHFSGKPPTPVTLIVKDDTLRVLGTNKKELFHLALVDISDVYVGIMSPVLREKKSASNAAAFTIKGGGYDLNLEAQDGETASKWLDGLKKALQSRSQEIVVNQIAIQ